MALLDGFEDNDIAEYAGHTSYYTTQSTTVIDDNNGDGTGYTLEGTSAYGELGNTNAALTRGNKYRCKISIDFTDRYPEFVIHAQDATNIHGEGYACHLDPRGPEFNLWHRSGTAGNTELASDTTISFSTGTTYIYEMWVEGSAGSGTLYARLLDSAGNQLSKISAAEPDSYTGGTFGFYNGAGGGGMYYDTIEEDTGSLSATGTTAATATTSGTGAVALAAPAITGFSQTNAGTGTVSWNDNSADEAGYRVYHAFKYGSNRNWGDWFLAADLAPDTTSYQDDNVPINDDIRYKVEAYDSAGNTASDTDVFYGTQRIGLAVYDSRRRADDWAVRLEHPSGTVIRPPIRGDPQYLPTLNGLPKIRVPVPYDETWLNSNWERATMYVWHGRNIYPIEQVEEIETYEDHMVIVGIGGVDLREHFEDDIIPSNSQGISYYIDTSLSTYPIDKNVTRRSVSDRVTLYERHYDSTRLDILNQLCAEGNLLWEVRAKPNSDQSTPPDLRLEVAPPGARTATAVEQEPLTFQTTKTLEDAYGWVQVRGKKHRTENEVWTANISTFVALSRSRLDPNNIVVTTTDGATTFDRGTDYDFDYKDGEIRALSGGSMTDATDYHASYDWRPVGSHGTKSNHPHFTRHISGVQTNNEATAAAEGLFKRVDEPLYKGEITIPYPDPDETLVTGRKIEGIPSGGSAFQVEGIDHGRDKITLTVGTRGTLSEAIDWVEREVENINQHGV